MPSLPWIVRRCLQLALLFAGVAFFSLTLSAAANAAPAAGIHVDTPNGNVANVRQEPTTQAPVLRRLADGTELNATHRVRASNGKVWVELAAGGYISADLVAGDPALPMKTITTGPAPEAPKPETPKTDTPKTARDAQKIDSAALAAAVIPIPRPVAGGGGAAAPVQANWMLQSAWLGYDAVIAHCCATKPWNSCPVGQK